MARRSPIAGAPSLLKFTLSSIDPLFPEQWDTGFSDAKCMCRCVLSSERISYAGRMLGVGNQHDTVVLII